MGGSAEEAEHVVVVPADHQAFAFDADLEGSVLLDEVDGDVPNAVDKSIWQSMPIQASRVVRFDPLSIGAHNREISRRRVGCRYANLILKRSTSSVVQM